MATTQPLVYRAEQVSDSLREQLMKAAVEHGKAVVVGPVFDTIKRVEDGLVVETLDRERLRWPLAWACVPEHRPESDPPAAPWFEGAAVVE